jgi:hypothetical protein
MKILFTTIIAALLFLLSPCYVSAQKNNSLLKKIERAVKKQEPSWKPVHLLVDGADIFADWDSREGRVTIFIDWFPINAPAATRGSTLWADNSVIWLKEFTKLMNEWKTTKLFDLGEDNYLYTNNNNPQASVAYYRGRACVFVTAPSSNVAERVARLIDRLLPAT